jgi:hypothetical protein
MRKSKVREHERLNGNRRKHVFCYVKKNVITLVCATSRKVAEKQTKRRCFNVDFNDMILNHMEYGEKRVLLVL